MDQSKQYNIAVIFPNWYAYLSEVMEGILAIHSIRQHCKFLNIVTLDFDTPVKFPEGYKPDGILVSYDDNTYDATWLDEFNVPIVNIYNTNKQSKRPSVSMDLRSTAKTAVEHFEQLGFDSVGILGTRDNGFQDQLNNYMEIECALQNLPFWKVDIPDGIFPGQWYRIEEEVPELKHILNDTKGRIGIYACHDVRARLLIDYCSDLGLSIPDKVGILGRFDSINARLSTPEISSIVVPALEIGAQAITMLINQIEGKDLGGNEHLVEVSEIRARESTIGHTDPDMIVLQARTIIRERACKGLTVDELVQSLPLARSTFEKRYRAMTGTSAANHIRETRLERARQLLLTTKRTANEIAFAVGFNDARPFSVFFKRETGETPNEFRKKFGSP